MFCSCNFFSFSPPRFFEQEFLIAPFPNCAYENPKFYAVESSEGTKRLETLIFEKRTGCHY